MIELEVNYDIFDYQEGKVYRYIPNEQDYTPIRLEDKLFLISTQFDDILYGEDIKDDELSLIGELSGNSFHELVEYVGILQKALKYLQN